MKTSPEGVVVKIMGKDLMVACPEDERESLIVAANYLDRKMREIHNAGKVIGAERCAIMAALNLANELLQLQKYSGLPPETSQKLRVLQNKIDSVLNP